MNHDHMSFLHEMDYFVDRKTLIGLFPSGRLVVGYIVTTISSINDTCVTQNISLPQI